MPWMQAAAIYSKPIAPTLSGTLISGTLLNVSKPIRWDRQAGRSKNDRFRNIQRPPAENLSNRHGHVGQGHGGARFQNFLPLMPGSRVLDRLSLCLEGDQPGPLAQASDALAGGASGPPRSAGRTAK